ncbi:NUDIX domain protein [Microbacterium hydrocarbonoxydans]|jgi:ADP-ribose pyrophosphatase|uniref:NUDIX domain protein n=1 Tax=Microbacterium hydrocarbonoxydans TaxID=273678 RepID=A0A0M2HJJ2_9MICO|nr:NUDIX hydrolase [Microbacterium hydrocarbonoxydans]KJL46859.1 NUDIX domain protein [Microbacterium hydrocarbonoxydans]
MSEAFQTLYESPEGQRLRLEGAQLATPDGRVYRHHRLVLSDGWPGAVVLAFDGADLLLVRSHRPAAGEVMWELLRGAGEPGESPVQTALRELAEETGLRGEGAVVLGSYLIDSSVFPQPVSVVECTVDRSAPRGRVDGEILGERWATPDELRQLVVDGVLRDAHSLTALSFHGMKEPRG